MAKSGFFSGDSTVYTVVDDPSTTPAPAPVVPDTAPTSFFKETGGIYDAINLGSDVVDQVSADAQSAAASASAASLSAGQSAASATASAASATAAAGSDADAANQVTLAAAQVTQAAAQVALATTQAGNAASSATASASSATSAASSASAATTQVGLATAQAGAASASATAASGSATAAAASSTNASASATAAAGSATAAANSAQEAETAASAASGGLIVSIIAHGGDPSGANDNTAALTAALAALTGTGGTVFFPAGRYKFASQVSYNIPTGVFSVSLVGAGQDASVLVWPAAAGGIKFNYSGISNSVHLRDLTLSTGAANGGNAINLSMASSVINVGVAATSDIYRVTLRGDDGYGQTDYWSTGLQIVNVSGIQVDTLTVAGSSSQQGIGCQISGLSASSTYAVLLDIAKSNFVWLSTGFIYGSFVQGITIDQTNFTFVTTGIGSAGSETGALVQLAVSNSQFNPGAVAGGQGINLATQVGACQLNNNFFVIGGANQFGIILQNAEHYQITANSIQGIGSTGSIGIQIGTTVSGAPGLISNNDIYGFNGAWGIVLQAGCANCLVLGNTFTANTVNVLDQGTGNTIRANPGVPDNTVKTTPIGSATLVAGAMPNSVALASLALQAGTYLMSAWGAAANASATPTAADYLAMNISTTSGAEFTGAQTAGTQAPLQTLITPRANAATCGDTSISPAILTVTTPATYFLNVQSSLGCTVYGSMTAQRIS